MFMLTILILLSVSLAFILLVARKRFRRLWTEIFLIRSEIQKSRKELISLRKQLLLGRPWKTQAIRAKIPV
jgi:hypothetical protein